MRVEWPLFYILRKVPLTARIFGASASAWLLASCWPGIRRQGSTSLIRLSSFVGVLWPIGNGFYCACQFLQFFSNQPQFSCDVVGGLIFHVAPLHLPARI